jgi:hypothetical protein
LCQKQQWRPQLTTASAENRLWGVEPISVTQCCAE